LKANQRSIYPLFPYQQAEGKSFCGDVFAIDGSTTQSVYAMKALNLSFNPICGSPTIIIMLPENIQMKIAFDVVFGLKGENSSLWFYYFC
jgi:hypothetical protein